MHIFIYFIYEVVLILRWLLFGTMVNGQGTNVKRGAIRIRPPLQLPLFAPGGGMVSRNGGLGYGLHVRRTTLAVEDRALHLGIDTKGTL
jgi:murein DD-endopeptidase MepM/ murein hydrolase activator NlpD